MHRRAHYDVTNRICICDPEEVRRATSTILGDFLDGQSRRALAEAFDTFSRLYAGDLPGYLGCDTWYHDVQHSLDCTLVMARLLSGHQRSTSARRRLDRDRLVLGIVAALFHDAGYIRRCDESHVPNGAAFTLTHVSRSAEFLAAYLPQIGLERHVEAARQLVHFTGYEIALDKIRVRHAPDRLIGHLLGSADLIAQLADRCYLEKCHDFLFREFAYCGLADSHSASAVYRSPQDLLSRTPAFIDKLFTDRLDGWFAGAYRLIDVHFGGSNPYLDTIHAQRVLAARLADQTRARRKLRRMPDRIHAPRLREILARPPLAMAG